jgi:hypothetical protein
MTDRTEVKEMMHRIARDYLGGSYGHEVFKPVDYDALVLTGRFCDRGFRVPLSGRELRLNKGNRKGLADLFIRRCMDLQNDLLGHL